MINFRSDLSTFLQKGSSKELVEEGESSELVEMEATKEELQEVTEEVILH